jgi:ABC-type sugar transport system ATPase subunit
LSSGSSGENAGRVQLIEPLGDATLVYFEYGGGSRLVAKVDPNLSFASGDNLTFGFEADQCHLFDVETGVRQN